MFARVLARLHQRVNLNPEPYLSWSKILMDEKLLNDAHWDEERQTYADYGLHTDAVSLVQPPPLDPSHPQHNVHQVMPVCHRPSPTNPCPSPIAGQSPQDFPISETVLRATFRLCESVPIDHEDPVAFVRETRRPSQRSREPESVVDEIRAAVVGEEQLVLSAPQQRARPAVLARGDLDQYELLDDPVAGALCEVGRPVPEQVAGTLSEPDAERRVERAGPDEADRVPVGAVRRLHRQGAAGASVRGLDVAGRHVDGAFVAVSVCLCACFRVGCVVAVVIIVVPFSHFYGPLHFWDASSMVSDIVHSVSEQHSVNYNKYFLFSFCVPHIVAVPYCSDECLCQSFISSFRPYS